MKKFFKIALYLFIIGLTIGLGAVYYVFNKPHRNIAKEKPVFTVNASTLLTEFSENEDSAYQKYGDKTILVEGIISELTKTDSSLNISLESEINGVNCAIDYGKMSKLNPNLMDNLSVGDSIKIKGKCDGYDMIMGVVLTQCIIEK